MDILIHFKDGKDVKKENVIYFFVDKKEIVINWNCIKCETFKLRDIDYYVIK